MNWWDNIFTQIIIFILISLYTNTFISGTIKNNIRDLHKSVKPMEDGTDIGWVFTNKQSGFLSNFISIGLMVIGALIIILYSFMNKTTHALIYFNTIVFSQLIYINTIGWTRLPDTKQGEYQCNTNNINDTTGWPYSIANCSQKIPSGHTMKLVITACILSFMFPKYYLLFSMLSAIGIYFVLAGRLHRTIDIVKGIIVGILLCYAKPNKGLFSKYIALLLVFIHIIKLLLMKKLHRYNKDKSTNKY